MLYRKLIFVIILGSFLTIPFISFGITEVGDVTPVWPPGDIPSPWPEPGPKPQPEPKPSLILTQVLRSLLLFCVAFAVNTLILVTGYLILRRKKLIKSWRFLKYIFLVTIGGALIDLIYVGGQYLSKFKGPLYPNLMLMGITLLTSITLTSLVLLFYNYWLSRKLFGINQKEAFFIGIIMGIFTNPGFYFLLKVLS